MLDVPSPYQLSSQYPLPGVPRLLDYLWLHPNNRLSLITQLLPLSAPGSFLRSISTSTHRITSNPDLAIRLTTFNHYPQRAMNGVKMILRQMSGADCDKSWSGTNQGVAQSISISDLDSVSVFWIYYVRIPPTGSIDILLDDGLLDVFQDAHCRIFRPIHLISCGD